MNILADFAAGVARHPDRIAIIDRHGRRTSYADLDARAAALARAWTEQGLAAGDRVLLAVGLDADLYAALAALWSIGAVAVFPEPALGLAGLKHAVTATNPRGLLVNGLYRLLLLVPAIRRISLKLNAHPPSSRRRPGPINSELEDDARCLQYSSGDIALMGPGFRRDDGESGGRGEPTGCAHLPPDHPALISFTSGSTGTPKSIVRSHGFLAAQDRAVAPLIAGDGEIDLVAFPVFVVANLGQGITSLLPNWSLRAPAKAKGAAIRAFAERHGVTRLLLSPAIAEALAKSGMPAGVHTLFTGGGPVFPDLIERIRAATPKLRIVSVYGSTEAEPIAHSDGADVTPADWVAMRAGAGLLAGTPAEAARVRILDDEVLVAGDHVVQAYLDPAHDITTKLRDADGIVWHRTGDGGRFDGEGRLWLRGRIGGRVEGHWPFEVEAPARFWPGVRRAALGQAGGTAVLAIEGDARHLAAWRAAGLALGIDRIIAVSAIPVDRRHGSKIDQARLDALIRKTIRD